MLLSPLCFGWRFSSRKVGFLGYRGGGYSGIGRFALVLDRGHGDPGCVEDLAAPVLRDGSYEDAVGGAGDEIADAFVAGKDGHGVAVGWAGVLAGKIIAPIVVSGHVRVE